MEEENLIEEQEQESMPDDSLFSSIISGFTGLDLGNEESENNVDMPMLLMSASSPSSNEYIEKIKVGDNTYNIQASSIGKIDHLTIEQEDTTTGLPSIYVHTGKDEINPTILLQKEADNGNYIGGMMLLKDNNNVFFKNGALYLAGNDNIILESSNVIIHNKRTQQIGEILKPTSEFSNLCLFNSFSQQVTVGPINTFRKKVYEYKDDATTYYTTRVEPDNNEFYIDTSGSTIKSRNDLLNLSGLAYDRNGNLLKNSNYFIKIGGATFIFEVDSNGKFGNPEICLTESSILYLSNGTLVKPTQGNHIGQTLCTNDQGSVLKESGYYIVEEDNVQYLIYCNNEFKGEKFRDYGQNEVNYLDIRSSGHCIEGYINNHVIFSPYSIVSSETSVDSGEPFPKRSISCDFEDIVKLVRYMKDNSQGPWSV